MDRQIPLLMGVSNAIIENVVFCHQDESLWPFSDQSNLKKIFDEVFDTTKYTKALTELRATSKKYTKYAKEFKQELDLQSKDFEHYTKSKGNVISYQKKVNELAHKIETSREELQKFTIQINGLKLETNNLTKIEMELSYIQQAMAEKRKRVQLLNGELQINNLTESELLKKEADLKQMKANFE